MVVPILHPRFRTDSNLKRNYAFTRSDLLLSSSEWTSLIVGHISRHLSLGIISNNMKKKFQRF